MIYRLLKFIRVVVAICVLLAFVAFFLDLADLPSKISPIMEKIPASATIERFSDWFATHAHWLAKVQFVPSFLASSFIVFGSLVALTLVFGRVYCSVVCPLGILQDVIAWFGRLVARFIPRGKDAQGNKIKKPKTWRNYEYRKNPIVWRIAFLIIALATIPLGLFYFGLIEPYGAFGRIVVNLFKPVYLAINNAAYAYCNEHELSQYAFYHIEVRSESCGALLVGIISFVALLVFAGRWGRLYCNSVCPVGTILGALSRFSFFRVRINQDRCIKCGMCSKACKSSCIDVANKRVDASRCVVCFDCFSRCKKGALSYSLCGGKSTDAEEAKTDGATTSSALDETTAREKFRLQKEIQSFDRSKRQFITLSLLATTSALASVAVGDAQEEAAPLDLAPTEDEGEKPADYGLTPFKREYMISPPGSQSHKRFTERCVGCHLCVAKCPQRILKPSGFEFGIQNFMQPRLDFGPQRFCNFDCTVCGEVCPTGAILPLTMEEKHLVQVGRVVFIKENCIVYAKDTSCGACSEHCPTQAIHMVPYKENLTIPETDEELCVGCGGCESICPAKPFRAVYIEGNPEHKQAKPVEVGETKEVDNVDFGF